MLALVVLSAAVGLGLMRGQAAPTESVPLSSGGERTAGSSGELYVHVLGAVANPGLYVLDLDARLVDAVAAAGTTEDADLAAINLARVLSDGEQIIVPVVGAAAADTGGSTPGDDRVDLNTADQAALETCLLYTSDAADE
mgnify:CR=1 FL=1